VPLICQDVELPAELEGKQYVSYERLNELIRTLIGTPHLNRDHFADLETLVISPRIRSEVIKSLRELSTFLPQYSYSTANSVTFSPDNKYVISTSGHTVWLWNISAQDNPYSYTFHSDTIWSSAISRDGTLLASCSKDKTIKLFRGFSEERGFDYFATLNGHNHEFLSVSISPDGSQLASSSADETIRFWNTHSGKPIGEPLIGHDDWVLSVSISPDGSRFASASNDGSFVLWDMHSRQIISKQRHGSRVLQIAFSQNGTILASASEDMTIRLWDGKTGEDMEKVLVGHTDVVRSLAFSPDSSLIVSSSWDNTVRIWQVSSRRSLTTLIGHSKPVGSVAFSPDGRLIASASNDWTVKLWGIG
jgi:WD40 repeat protein